MAIALVQNKEGTVTGGTSISITLGSTPVNGNRLFAVVTTTGATASRVSSITQTGVTWSRVVQETNSGGCTTELWATGLVSGGGTGVTINLAASLNAVGIVLEASGLGVTTDKTASTQNDFGTDTAVGSGTTGSTVTANELWVAGLGGASTAPYDAPTNGFTETKEQAGTSIELALETKIVSATGTASTAATPNPPPLGGPWAGVIATFPQASGTGGAASIQHRHRDFFGARTN